MSYIELNEINDLTNQGKSVFQYYFPDYQFRNKEYLKLRSEEKTASTMINFHDGLWRITDFGNQQEVNSMTAVHFVQWKEGLEFNKALHFIQERILMQPPNGRSNLQSNNIAGYEWREKRADDQIGKYSFTYKDEPSQKDLQSIGRYVTAELLKKYNCKSVEKYEYCNFSEKHNKIVVHIYSATENFPIFLFDYGEFKKLYKPFESKKQYRFLYIGTKTSDFIFGLSQLQNATNEFVNEASGDHNPPEGKPDARVKEVYRCSGESDALNLASLGHHVYWTNSETSGMKKEQWNQVDSLCQYHYQVMDLDETGMKAAQSFALKHINLRTIYLPKWLKQRKDWRGNPCKDLKDFIAVKGNSLEETSQFFQILKRKSMPMKFWSKTIAKTTGKITYGLNLEYYYHFLQAHGFYVTDSIYHRKAGYCYAWVKGKIIDLIHPDDIKKVVKRFTKEWVRGKNLKDEIAILNKINSSNQISEQNLQELPKIEPVFDNCSNTQEYLHFSNGSLLITKDSIEKVTHQDIPNHILGKLEINNQKISHLYNHNIQLEKEPMLEVIPTKEYSELLAKLKAAQSPTQKEEVNTEIEAFAELDKFELKINDKEFIFIQFLKDLANIHWRNEIENGQELSTDQKKEQQLVFINLLFVLGFNTAQYKSPDRPWLTFLQDMKISEVGKSTGRSGKSLLSQAIGHVRPTFYVAGRHKDITNKPDFIYDGFTIFHNNIEIDDLYEHADFNFFYTQVTGKREINAKFLSKHVLEYKDSGKMMISSNFELQNTDSSTLARILNAGVSEYYHEKTKHNDYLETRTPAQKFGKNLYEDFTDDEWSKFYNLIAYCIQLQQRFFKIQPPMANLEKRQLRREMSKGVGQDEPFWLWANSYFDRAPNTSSDEFSPEHEKTGYFNKYIVREKAFDDFKETLPKTIASRYKNTQFKTSLKAFCEYFGYELNPVNKCGENEANVRGRRIVKTINESSKEVIFIDTKDVVITKTEGDNEEDILNNEYPF